MLYCIVERIKIAQKIKLVRHFIVWVGSGIKIGLPTIWVTSGHWSHGVSLLKLHRSSRKYIFPKYTLHFNTIKYTKVLIKVYDASVKWNNSCKHDSRCYNRVIQLPSYRRFFFIFCEYLMYFPHENWLLTIDIYVMPYQTRDVTWLNGLNMCLYEHTLCHARTLNISLECIFGIIFGDFATARRWRRVKVVITL